MNFTIPYAVPVDLLQRRSPETLELIYQYLNDKGYIIAEGVPIRTSELSSTLTTLLLAIQAEEYYEKAGITPASQIPVNTTIPFNKLYKENINLYNRIKNYVKKFNVVFDKEPPNLFIDVNFLSKSLKTELENFLVAKEIATHYIIEEPNDLSDLLLAPDVQNGDKEVASAIFIPDYVQFGMELQDDPSAPSNLDSFSEKIIDAENKIENSNNPEAMVIEIVDNPKIIQNTVEMAQELNLNVPSEFTKNIKTPKKRTFEEAIGQEKEKTEEERPRKILKVNPRVSSIANPPPTQPIIEPQSSTFKDLLSNLQTKTKEKGIKHQNIPKGLNSNPFPTEKLKIKEPIELEGYNILPEESEWSLTATEIRSKFNKLGIACSKMNAKEIKKSSLLLKISIFKIGLFALFMQKHRFNKDTASDKLFRSRPSISERILLLISLILFNENDKITFMQGLKNLSLGQQSSHYLGTNYQKLDRTPKPNAQNVPDIPIEKYVSSWQYQ